MPLVVLMYVKWVWFVLSSLKRPSEPKLVQQLVMLALLRGQRARPAKHACTWDMCHVIGHALHTCFFAPGLCAIGGPCLALMLHMHLELLSWLLHLMLIGNGVVLALALHFT
jgi:hypothetical protein